MKYTIREIRDDEYVLLNDFLYEALFVPEGAKSFERSIIQKPELQVYVKDFGTEKDDICFVAEIYGLTEENETEKISESQIGGTVWVRDMEDYGHIEAGVPSFAISLYKEYRGLRIGTALMERMLQELRIRGYEKASLSVQKANYAVNMYRKLGFEIYKEDEEEYIMVYNFSK